MNDSNNPFAQQPLPPQQQAFPYVFQQQPVPHAMVAQPQPAMYYPPSNDNVYAAPAPHQFSMPLQQPVPSAFPVANAAPMFYTAQQPAVPQLHDNTLVPASSSYGVLVEPDQQPQAIVTTTQQAPMTGAAPVSITRIIVIVAVALIAFAIVSVATPLIFVRRDSPPTPPPTPSYNCYYNPKGNVETLMSIYDYDKISKLEIHGIAQVAISNIATGSAITVTMQAASLQPNDFAAVMFTSKKLNGVATITSKLTRNVTDCTWAKITVTIPTKFVLPSNFALNVTVDRNATMFSGGNSLYISGPYSGRFNMSSLVADTGSVAIDYANFENITLVNATSARFYNMNVTNLVANITYSLGLNYVNLTNVNVTSNGVDAISAFVKNGVFNVTSSASFSFNDYAAPVLYSGRLDFILNGELGSFQSNFTQITYPYNTKLEIKETSLKRYHAIVGTVVNPADMNSISVTVVGAQKGKADPRISFTMTKRGMRKRHAPRYVK